MTKVCIIGDHFMLSDIFEEKLFDVIDREELTIEKHMFNWPDEPLVHGYTTPGMDGLKEYFGTSDDVVERVGDADILITHLAPMSSDMLAKLPNLKMIADSRGGPVNIDLEACRERNVLVVNTPGRNASAVAEFTIGAILVETRKIRASEEALRKGDWNNVYYRADSTGRELCEMTIGIVGYGAIGRLTVGLLKVFGCQILVYDPYATLSDEDQKSDVEMVSLEELLKRSDVVSLHPKVTPETVGMMNADTFAQMKQGAVLVNTTRGSLCDDDALVEALTNGPLGSAMIDTFTTEPVPMDHPLLSLPNVTLTPHVAGASVRTVAYAAEQIAEEVRRFLNGEPAVNPQ
ncbi:MAG: 2-hydroxyacid dehydrogenase [Rhizobiaceae bacterium]|nr:2-hydroxyacid dehydrogenase [Rhizobiaceae bacterium]